MIYRYQAGYRRGPVITTRFTVALLYSIFYTIICLEEKTNSPFFDRDRRSDKILYNNVTVKHAVITGLRRYWSDTCMKFNMADSGRCIGVK